MEICSTTIMRLATVLIMTVAKDKAMVEVMAAAVEEADPVGAMAMVEVEQTVMGSRPVKTRILI